MHHNYRSKVKPLQRPMNELKVELKIKKSIKVWYFIE
jgi:hypothetical protein